MTNMRFINKKTAIISIVIWICLVLSNVFMVEAETEDKEIVKVACFSYEGFFQITEDGEYTGYGVDYLKEIAKYTGWEYEYVTGTWDQCINALENGEVDFMTMIPKTEEKEEIYEYTQNETNSSIVSLITRDDSQYAYEDFEKFDGIKIGIIGGRALIDKYCQTNEFTAEYVVFNDLNMAIEAMDTGTIDAIVTGDIIDMSGYMVIGSVGVQKFYMAAPKGKTDIINGLDAAIDYIKTEKPDFESKLYEKHFSGGKNFSPVFTAEEKEYIKAAPTIKVALYENRNVLSSYNKKTGDFSGIAYDIMNLLDEKSGLTFEYSIMPQGVRGYEYFQSEECDVIAPITTSRFITVSELVQYIELDIQSEMVMVGRDKYVFNAQESFVIALSKNFFNAEEALKELYPNARVVYYESQEKCFEAVYNKEADVTLENRLVALYIMRSPYYENLIIYEAYDEPEQLGIIVGRDADPLLISILKKTINSITDENVNNILLENTASSAYKYSVAEIIYQMRHYIIFLVVVICIFLYLIVFIFMLKRKGREYSEEKKYLEERQQADAKYREELYIQANYDSKTGLLNRNGFYEKTRQLIDENKDIKFVILRGDIDQFKVFNDIMGVKNGDEIIKYIAGRWKEYFEKHLGTYGYLGGDDYICCYPYKLFDSKEVMNTIGKWFEKYKKSYAFSISAGAYVVDAPDIDVNIMCDRAELALTKAKKNNDTHFCMFEKSMMEQAIYEQAIVNYIPIAFEKEQFQVYLQPQYDGMTSEIVGAEALTRWKHPEQGMIAPNVFIPVMEANGMITDLDLYVVEHVCRILRRLYDSGVSKKFSIAVNLSRMDTFDREVIDRIVEYMNEYNVPTDGIRLEITESAYIEQHEQVSGFVKELKEKGFTIEMDDFGSGYSSLNTLKDVPVDTLKLDLRFLAGDNSKKGGIIIDSVIRMARWLGIPVIAEGVETQAQADFLRNVGCHYMQGFFFARPMPASEFEQLVAANSTEGITHDKYKEANIYMGDVLDSKNIAAVLLKKIGPAAIIEYFDRNMEAIMLNDEFCTMLGFDREEYLQYQLHMQDVLDCEAREKLLEKADSLVEKNSVAYEFEIEKNGKTRRIRCRMNLLSAVERRITMIAMLDDLTEK